MPNIDLVKLALVVILIAVVAGLLSAGLSAVQSTESEGRAAFGTLGSGVEAGGGITYETTPLQAIAIGIDAVLPGAWSWKSIGTTIAGVVALILAVLGIRLAFRLIGG